MIARRPIDAPAYTTAPQQTVTSCSSTSDLISPPAALDPGRRRGRLPSTAPSSITQRSPTSVPLWMTAAAPITVPAPIRAPSWITVPCPIETESSTTAPGSTYALSATTKLGLPPERRRLLERTLQRLENADDPQATLAVGARLLAAADAFQEVLALQPQRLDVRDPGAEDVSTAGDVLAVAASVLVESLVIDGQLAFERHVVERRHPPRAHDREAAVLVGIQPRQVQMRREPGRKAHEAEHHVLDPRPQVRLAVREDLPRLLAREVQQDRDIVRTEAPQSVL